MHGVLRRYTLKPKDVDEVVRRITEGGVPIIKAIPGFVVLRAPGRRRRQARHLQRVRKQGRDRGVDQENILFVLPRRGP